MKKYKDIAGDGGSNIVGQVEAQHGRLSERLAAVHAVVAIVSGKGGVGKSSLTANLACCLALGGFRVGVLDADLNGPTMAKMLGVRGQRLVFASGGVEPPRTSLGVKVMSMDLLLPSDSAPLMWDAETQAEAHTWRGSMEASALREFLADTNWGELDALLLAGSGTLLRRSGRRSQRPRRDGRGRTRKPTAVTSAPKFCVQCGSRLVAVREEGRTRRRCPRCGWTFYGYPVPAAVALVTRGGRLLLTRRARPPYAATWDLLGGFLEAGEHPEACLRRELREELGMRARQARFVDFALDRYGPKGFPLLTLVYRVMPGPGRLRPGDDVSEARWFQRRAIPYREIAFPGLPRPLRRRGSGRETPAPGFWWGIWRAWWRCSSPPGSSTAPAAAPPR